MTAFYFMAYILFCSCFRRVQPNSAPKSKHPRALPVSEPVNWPAMSHKNIVISEKNCRGRVVFLEERQYKPQAATQQGRCCTIKLVPVIWFWSLLAHSSAEADIRALAPTWIISCVLFLSWALSLASRLTDACSWSCRRPGERKCVGGRSTEIPHHYQQNNSENMYLCQRVLIMWDFPLQQFSFFANSLKHSFGNMHRMLQSQDTIRLCREAALWLSKRRHLSNICAFGIYLQLLAIIFCSY